MHELATTICQLRNILLFYKISNAAVAKPHSMWPRHTHNNGFIPRKRHPSHYEIRRYVNHVADESAAVFDTWNDQMNSAAAASACPVIFIPQTISFCVFLSLSLAVWFIFVVTKIKSLPWRIHIWSLFLLLLFECSFECRLSTWNM